MGKKRIDPESPQKKGTSSEEDYKHEKKKPQDKEAVTVDSLKKGKTTASKDGGPPINLIVMDVVMKSASTSTGTVALPSTPTSIHDVGTSANITITITQGATITRVILKRDPNGSQPDTPRFQAEQVAGFQIKLDNYGSIVFYYIENSARGIKIAAEWDYDTDACIIKVYATGTIAIS